jgi:hypothetical protein
VEVLDRDARVEYLRRSFFAVDGLWFVNCESRFSFETALELDEGVWSAMGKVQARKARELSGAERDLRGLAASLPIKFESEGWQFRLREEEKRISVEIDSCPWYRILEKSGRTHLEPQISKAICQTEYREWAREFGEDIAFSHSGRGESGKCLLTFSREDPRRKPEGTSGGREP